MPAARQRPVEIRDARPEDLPALGRFGARLARAHHAWDPARFFLPEEPLEEGYAWWLGRELRNPQAILLAAASGRRLIGYAYGLVAPRDWNMLLDRCGVAVDLWVEPAARRRGVGAALTEALVARLAARKVPRVVLSAAAKNARARKVFASLGFRETMIEMTREVAPPATARRPSTRRAASRASRPRARPVPVTR